MKTIHLIFLLLITLNITLGCTKDDISQPDTLTVPNLLPPTSDDENYMTSNGMRDGTLDLIFYRTSLTSDNYLLLSSSQARVRTHKVYNKSKVKEISFVKTGTPDANIGSVLMSHYKLEIKFTDNTTETLTAYSKKSTASFIFTPTGENLLASTNNTKYVSYETTGLSSVNPNVKYYNPWRDETHTLFRWTIKKENSIVITKEIEPINKNSKQFTVIHIN